MPGTLRSSLGGYTTACPERVGAALSPCDCSCSRHNLSVDCVVAPLPIILEFRRYDEHDRQLAAKDALFRVLSSHALCYGRLLKRSVIVPRVLDPGPPRRVCSIGHAASNDESSPSRAERLKGQRLPIGRGLPELRSVTACLHNFTYNSHPRQARPITNERCRPVLKPLLIINRRDRSTGLYIHSLEFFCDEPSVVPNHSVCANQDRRGPGQTRATLNGYTKGE